MQVTEIRRLMSFGQRENVSMTARVDDGEDPQEALRRLEEVMVEGIRRYEEASVQRCRICGCTEDHACYGGCYWVERDLCSTCAVSDEFVKTYAHDLAEKACFPAHDLEVGHRRRLVELVTAEIIDAYRKGRRAMDMGEARDE